MEDSTSSQTSVLNSTSSTSVQNVVFCYKISFVIRQKKMTMTGHFPWSPRYVLHEFLFKSHEEQSNGESWKGGFSAFS